MKLVHLCALAVTISAAPVLAADPAPGKVVVVKKVEASELIKSISGKSIEGATPEHEALLASCPAMKFETSVEVGSGETARVTKVKMCSRAGETTEQWISSLGDAATKIEANLDLAPDSRAKLVAAINAEIARLKS